MPFIVTAIRNFLTYNKFPYQVVILIIINANYMVAVCNHIPKYASNSSLKCMNFFKTLTLL